MPATIFTPGDLSNGSFITSGNDGTLVLQSGLAGAKVNALTLNPNGTMSVLGSAAPAFSANASGNQAIANSTATKVALQTKLFDTANAFDAVTNYRFTPQVAGYYQINATIRFDGTSITVSQGLIYKNGLAYLVFYSTSLAVTQPTFSGSAVVFLNGTTDYIELYGLGVASSGLRFDSTLSTLSGAFFRSA